MTFAEHFPTHTAETITSQSSPAIWLQNITILSSPMRMVLRFSVIVKCALFKNTSNSRIVTKVLRGGNCLAWRAACCFSQRFYIVRQCAFSGAVLRPRRCPSQVIEALSSASRRCSTLTQGMSCHCRNPPWRGYARSGAPVSQRRYSRRLRPQSCRLIVRW